MYEDVVRRPWDTQSQKFGAPVRRRAESIRKLPSTNELWSRPPPELAELRTLESEKDHALARAWVEGFELGDVPKGACEVGYSRSSGPGGQHVNKTNSKASLRCDLGPALGVWLPRFVLAPLSKSPYYHPNPPSLLVNSQETRSSMTNLETAQRKLYEAIFNAAKSVIVGETTQETKDRIAANLKAAKARLKVAKQKRSAFKADKNKRNWE
ncbi:hypothetical protein BCR39DRAFT_601052 [Naematelia encephala]|uniref:Prokaryotic-type class I peptide chain release factors domain-containing protein n=1 Tax=Naematelia encephala TaxID=71784 RepID=A0A1Y2AJ38_9TREE|nr:hypothetical protein BCR39DRAFT_601052 [Naematelia encephala]